MTRKNYILIAICGFLVISSVFLTIEASTLGVEAAKLDKTAISLNNQKRVLEENLVKGISMSQLQEESIELGFNNPDNLIYISAVSAVAKLP